MEKLLAQLGSLWGELRRGHVSGVLARYSDLLLPVCLMLAIGMLFIPLPPAVISVLIVVNLAAAVIVLSTSLYITTPTQLTSYPTILLLTTVFRLTLSVSATRAILTQGTAGGVIEALGQVTAQGSIIVGAVMFVTILVVQFIVVAKGSERVAEVAARFTLDAMPGKQMSIDADMRSGLITQEQARRSRTALQKESQLYGAMDGAMKFVKGDSIATIVIAMVNIAGGLATGVLVRGMTFAQAGHKYTIMTIGDGLAAIISSMLITVSAGIVVTRVSTDEETSNVGSDISRQLLRNPKPIMIGAGLLLLMALLPGMPGVPLLLVGGGLAGISYTLVRAQRRAAKVEAERVAKTGAAPGQDELQPTFAVPLAVVVSSELTQLVDPKTVSGARFRAEMPKLRSAVYYDLGVLLPGCYVSGDAPLKANQYFIAIKEVPVVY